VRDLLYRRLLRRSADALEVEETALALLAAIVRAASTRSPARSGTRARTRARRQEQVEAVRTRLLADPAGKASLDDLARLTHTTPYHLARSFNEEIGIPIHQYRLRLRLALAIPLLLDTGRPAGRIALELGFSSHSHFTETFRRMTGVAPGALRPAADVSMRNLRRNLIAPR
jgi:AraC family transcriptional regulator